MNNNLLKVYAGIILATIFWGLSFIGTSFLLKFLNPVLILTLRLSIAIMFLYAVIKAFKLYEPIQKRHLKYFLILSFVEPYTYFIGETYSLKYLSPTVVAIIISTIPLFIPFTDYFFYKTKIRFYNILGIVISIIGVCLTLINEKMTLNISFIGIIFVYIAVFSAVVYTLLLKKVSSEYKAINIIFYQNLIGFPFFIVTLFFTNNVQIASPDVFKIIIVLILLAIFPTSLAYLFYTYSIEKIGISKTGAFVNFIPIVTLIASSVFFNETLTSLKIIGITLVIVGLFISQKN